MNVDRYLEKNIPNLEGKLYIITGANSGLGFDATLILASKGASIIMACRSLERANKAKEKILEKVPQAKLYLESYDQASFQSIDNFCNKVKTNYSNINGLICNAGVYFPKQDYKTNDGFELTFGTNYLGNYKLISGLKDLLDKNSARVVIVTSLTATLANKKLDIDKFDSLSRNKVYGYSKYCLSRLFYELDQEENNITYYLAHPGIASTNIISSQQTGLPHWFQVLGHRFLTIFTHSSRKASLILIKALLSDEKNKYVVPRGLFAISGFPKFKKVPNYVKKPIVSKTIEYLNRK